MRPAGLRRALISPAGPGCLGVVNTALGTRDRKSSCRVGYLSNHQAEEKVRRLVRIV